MTPILSADHTTFRRPPAVKSAAPAPIAILTDDIVIGMPLIEAWKEMSYDDLLYCIQIANPDTHIRRIQICNGGLSVRIFV